MSVNKEAYSAGGQFDAEGPPPNLYYDRYFGMEAAKILPGEFYVSSRDMVLVTVLGSCVGACIRDPISGIGGMNHFMLPINGEEQFSMCAPSARYGVHAMEMLLNQLTKLGARRGNLEAKVFGGGNVMTAMTRTQIGPRNAEFVLDFLERERIPLAAADLLEDYPRKIYYFPRTGKVLMKKLHVLANNTIFQREEEYQRRLAQKPVEGHVELF
ncbi:MAG TPA: chemoreceptor glutamine deamidase CheD [Burkholderiales bacterium]|nr:chemoreceptor glutamine deamidase CheD [Burkholderiales bacterium]